MAPKKNPHLSQSQPTNDFENLSQVEMLKQMKEMAATMASLSNRFDKLERMWSDTKEANRQLQNALQEKDREINNIRERMNEQEQYTRSWSIRVLNMKLPQSEASDPLNVMQQVYNRLLLPILQGALTNKLLTTIPTAEQILKLLISCHASLEPHHQSSPGSIPGTSGP
jgi:septal ring factor EnvC (AmiA/AmiB activator)